MQDNKPPFSLEIFDNEKQICSAVFALEPKKGILARSGWLNVSAIENIRLTVTHSSGKAHTIPLTDGQIRAQFSNDDLTITVQGSQGFNRLNLAFTVFIKTKKREVAA